MRHAIRLPGRGRARGRRNGHSTVDAGQTTPAQRKRCSAALTPRHAASGGPRTHRPANRSSTCEGDVSSLGAAAVHLGATADGGTPSYTGKAVPRGGRGAVASPESRPADPPTRRPPRPGGSPWQAAFGSWGRVVRELGELSEPGDHSGRGGAAGRLGCAWPRSALAAEEW